MKTQDPSLATQVRLLKVIADETRLRILGLLSEQDRSGKEIASALALSPPTVCHHMRKLTDAGIVLGRPDAQRQLYSLNTALLREVRRADAPPAEAPASQVDVRAKTLRNFFDGDRLKTIPAQRKQRVIILQKLLERFEPGRAYAEREVNGLLKRAHEDFATLRRELVDYGFLTRVAGVYRVADTLPARSTHVAQEITGDENAWLAGLISASVRSSR
jgi:biotin operon repressor